MRFLSQGRQANNSCFASKAIPVLCSSEVIHRAKRFDREPISFRLRLSQNLVRDAIEERIISGVRHFDELSLAPNSDIEHNRLWAGESEVRPVCLSD